MCVLCVPFPRLTPLAACIATYAAFRPCGQDIENVLQADVAPTVAAPAPALAGVGVEMATEGAGYVTTRPGTGGAMCMFSFSVFLFNALIMYLLPEDCSGGENAHTVDADTIREGLLVK